MLQKRAAPSILDDVALPLMRRAQEEKHHTECASSSGHTGPSDLVNEEDRVVRISKSATIRYQPEPLTKEELDFFLSLEFEADDNGTGTAASSTCASFPVDTVLVDIYSANGLQDPSSTMQSNISSLSATIANAGGYRPNQSFSTLNTSTSSTSTLGDAIIANQVQGQEIKLISTMKRSAESRDAIQRMAHTFFPTPLPNGSFDINTSATYCNRNACSPSGTGMNTIETKRKHEAMMGTEKDAGFEEVRTHSVFDFCV